MKLKAGLRFGLAVACMGVVGSCTAPYGITREGTFPGSIDIACMERSVREVPGLTDVTSGRPEDAPAMKGAPAMSQRILVLYQKKGVTDVEPFGGATLSVDHNPALAQFVFVHTMPRGSNKSVTKAHARKAIDLMKRVEAAISSACGVDLPAKIQMGCPSEIPCEAVT